MNIDRGFSEGDEVELENTETGGLMLFKIGYILHGGRFGLEPGFCIMQLEGTEGL